MHKVSAQLQLLNIRYHLNHVECFLLSTMVRIQKPMLIKFSEHLCGTVIERGKMK